ncbi:MAG: M23 family metallopeptidase [Candidatus Abyssobacteria bacterium SURF_5]|uniref:M23 family metallopeptidase n=1 Tax=Abyssobacteria bacterium (strain SURF_5) TaxID=2093360 RepID=A0A3A4NMU0_ABYX5|nr:MAG: M23 family metallopeptidase [Candidatus Abyssubacteria bacterium SURF_5]
MQKKWNVLIVPNSPGRDVYSFELSLKSLRRAAAGAASLLIISFLALVLVGYTWRQSKADRIASLETQLKHRDVELSQLNREFAMLKDLEEKLRTMAGLEPRDRMEGPPMGGGQGGPSPSDDVFDYAEVFPESPDLPRLFSPGDLKKGSSDLKNSFEEVLQIFEREKARLSSIPSINPVCSQDAWISSAFGYREDPISGDNRFHEGCDIVAPRKTPIVAPADGIVSFAGWSEGMGRMVEIEHGYGYTTRYGHAAKLFVKRGDMVMRGDVIAHVGSSGRSTGPHLHYEVRYNNQLVNPYQYLVE